MASERADLRPLHSKSILDHVNKGLNMKKPVHRTVSVAIDLSKAFDTVDHQLLLNDIKNLPLNDYIIRFLCAYLRGRYTYVFFRNAKSKNRKVKQGVPQGGVLSLQPLTPGSKTEICLSPPLSHLQHSLLHPPMK
jgi:retron-type reverse transcriptase